MKKTLSTKVFLHSYREYKFPNEVKQNIKKFYDIKDWENYLEKIYNQMINHAYEICTNKDITLHELSKILKINYQTLQNLIQDKQQSKKSFFIRMLEVENTQHLSIDNLKLICCISGVEKGKILLDQVNQMETYIVNFMDLKIIQLQQEVKQLKQISNVTK